MIVENATDVAVCFCDVVIIRNFAFFIIEINDAAFFLQRFLKQIRRVENKVCLVSQLCQTAAEIRKKQGGGSTFPRPRMLSSVKAAIRTFPFLGLLARRRGPMLANCSALRFAIRASRLESGAFIYLPGLSEGHVATYCPVPRYARSLFLGGRRNQASPLLGGPVLRNPSLDRR
jgi:hypothetical protein